MVDLFGTGVYLRLLPASSFRLPPDDPPTLPPPSADGTLKTPFALDSAFYNAALSPVVPITFAVSYFSLVTIWNQANRRRKYKPWALSQTRFFHAFTILHNILLAAYSAITFIAMVRAVYQFFPGWNGPHGVVGAVDALCKMHGPRGYGDAVTYNATTRQWSAKNYLIKLDPFSPTPDSTDLGRLWNEGLAFWGFWFYLSKFYEVLDTVIILTKGKRSSTLQTYHHTGAMFCMWAGIRYMSVPIYMFVLINSFIHTLMYTFYTVTTLGYRVPQRLKRLITTLQIMQLMTGVFYASAHLAISYDVPVSTLYKIAAALSSPSSASEVASELFADATQAAQMSGDLPPWVKRLAYRAAGAEGLAESVHDGNIYTDRQAARNRYHLNETEPIQEQKRHLTHYETVPCIDTNGQVFAVWLNVAYLVPLFVLFVRFFIKAYIKKSNQGSKPKQRTGSFDEARRWSESAQEAARRTTDVVESLGVQAEEALDDTTEEIEETAKVAVDKGHQAVDNLKEKSAANNARQSVNTLKHSTADKLASAKDATQSIVDELPSVEEVKGSIASKLPSAKEVKETASSKLPSTEQVKETAASRLPRAKEVKESIASKVPSETEAKDSVDDSYIKVVGDLKEGFGNGTNGEDGNTTTQVFSSTVRNEDGSFSTTTSTSRVETSSSSQVHSYAEAVKEDLEDTPVTDGSMGFGLNG